LYDCFIDDTLQRQLFSKQRTLIFAADSAAAYVGSAAFHAQTNAVAILQHLLETEKDDTP